jgi:hypothetical protein
MTGRPLVLIASEDAELVGALVSRLGLSALTVIGARSSDGCVRVATAIGPDVVLLDAALPRSVEGVLRAHPVSASARVHRLSAQALAGLRDDPLGLLLLVSSLAMPGAGAVRTHDTTLPPGVDPSSVALSVVAPAYTIAAPGCANAVSALDGAAVSSG